MTSQLSNLFRRRSSAKSFSSEVEQELRNSKAQLFDFATLKSATNNFADKIGPGGFGSVYKGRLANGQLVAVKWFEITSQWGIQQLINIVVLASRLEHKNINKPIGYSIKNEKVVLIVENYLQNGTLHQHLFDPTKRQQLDWETRYKIIEGIAHGILYLHEGLEFRIVHRDIKPRSIMIDFGMNPKISRFSLAKTVTADQPEGSCEVAGTQGYISPEHLLLGAYSTKSDIFSFGITILEMVTGQVNYCLDGIDLYSYVWKHWKEGTIAKVIDPSIVDQCPKEEVRKCIHVGLICAQDKPEERPTIASVVLMLITNSIRIREPKPRPDPYNRYYDNDTVLENYDSEVAEDSDLEEAR